MSVIIQTVYKVFILKALSPNYKIITNSVYDQPAIGVLPPKDCTIPGIPKPPENSKTNGQSFASRLGGVTKFQISSSDKNEAPSSPIFRQTSELTAHTKNVWCLSSMAPVAV
jgi:hypothetical protein